MHRRLSFLLIAALLPACLPAQDIMPLADVKSGMTGIGRTVFRGEQPEEFPIEVVDIVRNFYPKRNLIIIRLKGDKAEHTGVAAGMSGSPIFVDGKMIGALSYSIGVFLREPLAGVTPVEEMLEIITREETRDRELAAFVPPAPNNFLEMSLGLTEPSWENFMPQELLQRRMALSGAIRPIDLPLAFGGAAEICRACREFAQPAGFQVISSGSAGSSLPQESVPILMRQARRCFSPARPLARY
jgi:hypothetical protein